MEQHVTLLPTHATMNKINVSVPSYGATNGMREIIWNEEKNVLSCCLFARSLCKGFGGSCRAGPKMPRGLKKNAGRKANE